MRTILIGLCLLTKLVCFAQAFDLSEFALSPNASTLGQYGEIPVSLFTGIPQIEIPIYAFSVDGHKFPISINYHTSGIRLEQKPSWVGAGWNLQAGGSIIRIQNGAADEDKPRGGIATYQGYFYNLQYLNQPDWGSQNFIDNYMSTHDGERLSDRDDVDADEFQFNFIGYTGSFFKDHMGNWQIRSKNFFRIEEMLLDTIEFKLPQNRIGIHTKVIKGFVLTGEDGTQYRFGFNNAAIDYSIPYSNQKYSNWTSVAWHLTEVKYPNGNTIESTYERGNFTSQIWYDLSIRGGRYGDNTETTNFHSPDSKTHMGVLISPSYLTEISFPLGTISFHSSEKVQLEHFGDTNGDRSGKYYYIEHGLYNNYNYMNLSPIKSRALDSVIVRNNIDSLILKSRFKYRAGAGVKLGLDTLEFFGRSEDCERYCFGYFNRHKLPNGYNTRKTDHWGYYLGRQWTSPGNFLYERNPTDSLAGYGVLNKITYPTGGYTKFEYEPHDCSFILNNTKTAVTNTSTTHVGGCRIKRIINSPTGHSSDEIVSKEYLYVRNYVGYLGNSTISSGILAGLPTYDVQGYVLTCPTDYSLTCSFNFRSMMHSVFSGGVNSMGSHIGYTYVVEKYPNGGFKIYTFSNYDNGYLDRPATAVYDGSLRETVKFSSFEHYRGLLLQEEEFDSMFCPIKAKIYSYSIDTTKFIRGFYINVLDNSRYIITSGSQYFYPFLEACTYKHFTSMPKLISEQELSYFSGRINTRIKKYQYNDYGQLSRMVEDGVQGDSIETIYQYIRTQDYSNADSDFIISPIFSIEKNYFYPFLSYWKDWNYKEFRYSRLAKNLYVPTMLLEANFDNSSQVNDTTLCEYDSKGHLLLQCKNNLQPTVYIWSYSGQHIVGIVSGATLNQVTSALSCTKEYLGSFPESNDSLMLQLRQQLPFAAITTYKYLSLIGMCQETNPAGISKYYQYDAKNRLIRILNNDQHPTDFYHYHINQ